MTRDEFIERAMRVHDGEGIDYSQVEYVNNRTKVKLIDPIYGEYWQTPSNHLKGQQHPSRKGSKISSSKRLTQEEVITRFNEVHKGEGLDYSKVEYKNMHTKVCIIDPIYGEYWQEPIVHLKGCGNPKRAIDRNADAQRYDTEKFVELCKKIHPNYVYDKVEYVSSKTKVLVICPKHGEFWAYPDLLLQGKGCPKCGNHLSHGEDELYDYVVSLAGKDNVIKGDKSVLDGSEIDVYVPSKHIGFEFDGLRWHSELFKDRNYHLNKTMACLEKGISLIHIFEDEWNEKKIVVMSKIKHMLGLDDSEKIYARKCDVMAISKDDAMKFLDENHIQGFSRSSIYVGCKYGNRIVSVMTFIKVGDGKYVLNRLATDVSVRCIGAPSKLFSWFVKNYSPKEISSFLDKRWAFRIDGNIYYKLGFKLEYETKPNYQYTDFRKRMHKFGFRKDYLHRKYGFPMDMKEKEMIDKLGYFRIWDCGLFKYVWKKSDL